MALGAGRGQRAKLARRDERQHRRRGIEHHRNASSDEIDHRRAAATVGNVQQVGSGEALEQLAGEVRRAAAAGRGERELSWACLRKRDHLLHGLRGQRLH